MSPMKPVRLPLAEAGTAANRSGSPGGPAGDRGTIADSSRFDRRSFLEWAAATAVATSAGACARERGRFFPYSVANEAVVPSNFVDYSTIFVRQGHATGVVVATREGRPVKVEGNPEHPASLGSTGAFEQASLMDLYNPSRARAVLRAGQPDSTRAFQKWMADRADAMEKTGGSGLRFLLEPTSSPHVASLRSRIAARFPNARFFAYAPLARDHEVEGIRVALGRTVEPRYDLSRAKTVVAFDSDLLTASTPGYLVYARQLADHRVPSRSWMNRLYVFEAGLSLLGMMADHRLAIRSADVGPTAVALLGEVARVLVKGRGLPQGKGLTSADVRALAVLADRRPRSVPDRWLSAIARELADHAGEALVIVGARQPPIVHAVGCALNGLLGNTGSTVSYLTPTLADATCGPVAIRELAKEIDRGQVDTLVIDAFDPVYSAPADIDFRSKLDKVEASVYRSLYHDSTAEHSLWHLPAAHEAESWGDARAFDGTISIQQPLIDPLFGGITLTELLAALVGDAGRSASSLLRDFWRSRVGDEGFERFWQDVLVRGVVPGTETASVETTPSWDAIARLAAASYPAGSAPAPAPELAPPVPTVLGVPTVADGAATPPPPAQPSGGSAPPSTASGMSAPPPMGSDGLEVNFFTDLTMYDGRYSNNGWLMEVPDPVTRLSWQNAAIVSPELAARWGAQTGDVVELRYRGRVLLAPLIVIPMIADHTVCLSLGWGRAVTRALGKVHRAGVNAYELRIADAPWFDSGLEVRKTGARETLIVVQGSQTTEDRPIALMATLSELEREPHRFDKYRIPHDSLYGDYPYQGLKWGMAIDLGRCIACASCVIACNAENNIPVVGALEVAKGREMQWLRIDRYFEPSYGNGTHVNTMPLACVHCEKAPCEYVCPVNATVHSAEGLNQMVYNRCVGTRFCSNNCPYKVRRFNWFAYQKDVGPVEQMLMNPEVTVRSRGVMEKCTYCTQRIERARISIERKGGVLRGEDVMTACQQACPTNAIIFGSLGEEQSAVAKLHADRRSYRLLHELNTRPRTAHLARIKNPNPELV